MSGTAPNKGYNWDRNLAFAEDLTLTATGNIQFAAADVIYQIGPGRMDAVLVINVTAIDISSGNELYDIYLQGSDSATLASGIEILFHLQLGHTSVMLGGGDVSSLIGRYECCFHNSKHGTVIYDYVRMRLIASGTTPSITFDAWIAQESE